MFNTKDMWHVKGLIISSEITNAWNWLGSLGSCNHFTLQCNNNNNTYHFIVIDDQLSFSSLPKLFYTHFPHPHIYLKNLSKSPQISQIPKKSHFMRLVTPKRMHYLKSTWNFWVSHYPENYYFFPHSFSLNLFPHTFFSSILWIKLPGQYKVSSYKDGIWKTAK